MIFLKVAATVITYCPEKIIHGSVTAARWGAVENRADGKDTAPGIFG
jgi:hypothetical protein